MKQFYKIAVLLLIPFVSFANHDKFKGKYTKEKTIKKEFSVNEEASLEVDNSYGNITIVSWNENRIIIEVFIKTNGNSEEKVQERLDEIQIELSGNSSKVTAKTNINANESSSWWRNSNSNVSMEINYVIKVPETNTIDLNNRYGAITVGNHKGTAKINNKYGQLSVGNLMADDNYIQIKYVKTATIVSMKSGKIVAGYSTFTLNNSEKLELVADYTTSNLGVIGDLNYRNRYGKLNADNAGDVLGEASYNNVKFEKISGNANFNLRYSGLTVGLLTATAKDVTIQGSYSGITLGIENGYAFDFEADLKYGSLKGTDFMNITSKDKSGSKSNYEGYHKNQNSENKISINSSYGSVTLNN
ncbi:hypothetical protein [Patiriisocius sp. Uisw_017]|jgi:hypothetical protein|uniref:hypothetical protein n=1 Tax=Patiriisocius sp. Uisw_017 TaxID=3230968 RepID=UPI0039E7C285